MSSTSTRQVVVGRIGKPHGIRGVVSVESRTDEPDKRFAAGTVLTTETPRGSAPHGPGRPARLTVKSVRWHQGRPLVTFTEIHDRNAAEAARGLVLVAEVPEDEVPEDPEEFYDHQLIGLHVVTTEGDAVGEVGSVVHGAAQDLLVVNAADGREVLVPFVAALVPEVDLAGRRVVVADRPGLLTELDDEEQG
ncbi:MAG: ribosome maturation factor RimM [Nocardioides sp.]